MRYIGIAIPVILLAAGIAAVAIRRRAAVITFFAFLLAALGFAAIGKVSDEFGYVLPWRTPHWLHHGGRDYSDPTACQTRSQTGPLTKVGWVYGYFTTSRRLYTVAGARRDVAPTLVWMEGNRSACLIGYSLSGGP